MKVARILTVAATGIAAAVTASSQAENINIDMGPATSAPSSLYGAASGQTGNWNTYTGGGVLSGALLDVTGSLTDVTIQSMGLNGIYTSSFLNYAAQSADLANLLNDVLDSSTGVTINNLDAGVYNIYTYATDPDVRTTAGTIVTIGGNSQTIIGPAVAANTMIQGTHYAFHTINHAGGALVISLADAPGGAGFWNCNGIQIVTVPGPGALALLGVAGLIGSRRRRN